MSMDENMEMQKKLFLFPTLRVPFGSSYHKDYDILGSIKILLPSTYGNLWRLPWKPFSHVIFYVLVQD